MNNRIFVSGSKAESVVMDVGHTRKNLCHSEELSAHQYFVRKGSKFPIHSHPHAQFCFVISGKTRVTIGSERFECSEGDSYLIRPNVRHATEALEDLVTVDVFVPARTEYLTGR